MTTSRRSLFLGAGGACLTDFRRFSADPNEPATVAPLWPDVPPGGPAPVGLVDTIDDQIETSGLRYRVATSVARPTVSIFPAARPTGAAALVIPGGGYSRVGIDREGYETARWLAAQGTHAFVLRYRLPNQGWTSGPEAPLQDAQRALRLIRSGTLGVSDVDDTRVWVLGFSAGGHLAGRLATRTGRSYAVIDAVDRMSARPDGAILVYPVINLGPGTHPSTRDNLLGASPTPANLAAYSVDVALPTNVPPALLLHSARDRAVSVDQSLRMWQALRAVDSLADLHVFSTGDHGAGLRSGSETTFASWPHVAGDWLSGTGLK